MEIMKRYLILFAISGAVMFAAELSAVRTVYVLPMSKGFDQYLANRLTNQSVFQVVTDPTKADAIFTDSIGESLEQTLDAIVPTAEPEPAKPAAPASVAPPVKTVPAVADSAAKPDAKADAKSDSKKPAGPPPGSEIARGDVGAFSDPVNKLTRPVSSFGRSRGTVFLVDAKTREVLWSAYKLPRNTSSKQLDRTAAELTKRIKRDLDKK
jgi:hypothetical protein